MSEEIKDVQETVVPENKSNSEEDDSKKMETESEETVKSESEETAKPESEETTKLESEETVKSESEDEPEKDEPEKDETEKKESESEEAVKSESEETVKSESEETVKSESEETVKSESEDESEKKETESEETAKSESEETVKPESEDEPEKDEPEPTGPEPKKPFFPRRHLKPREKKQVGLVVGLTAVLVVAAVFLAMKFVIIPYYYPKEPDNVEIQPASFATQLEYTTETDFTVSANTFFTDLDGRVIAPPNGMAINSRPAKYSLGSVDIKETGDNNEMYDVVIRYNLWIGCEFTFKKGAEYSPDLAWSSYFNEFLVIDRYSGRILNVNDIKAGEDGQDYNYHLTTETGIYDVFLNYSVEAYDASFSEWKKVSDGLYTFESDDDYSVFIHLVFPKEYDGIILALPKNAYDRTESVERSEKDVFFLENPDDNADNYYILELKSLM